MPSFIEISLNYMSVGTGKGKNGGDRQTQAEIYKGPGCSFNKNNV